MLSRRIAAVRPLTQALRPAITAARTPSIISQLRHASSQNTAELDDPNMNGGYPVVPAEKRQFRDPYGDWWDEQERRNYGEPVHEDNDILGMFSPEEYTHFTPGWGAVLLGTFVATLFAGLGLVRLYYPDKPAVPRTFPGGLDRELGGKGALPARANLDDL